MAMNNQQLKMRVLSRRVKKYVLSRLVLSLSLSLPCPVLSWMSVFVSLIFLSWFVVRLASQFVYLSLSLISCLFLESFFDVL
jgi:hypothetical protein